MLQSATLLPTSSRVIAWPSASPIASPFGSSLPNRAWSDVSRGYRYGFNGKEKDTETANDAYDFGARIYDGRLGRWLSLDPFKEKYPSLSVYCFGGSNPMFFVDIDGRIIVPHGVETLTLLHGIVNEQEAKYIALNSDGQIDANLMLQYILLTPSNQISQNFRSLVSIAKSADVYNYTIACSLLILRDQVSKDINGNEVWKLDEKDLGWGLEEQVDGNVIGTQGFTVWPEDSKDGIKSADGTTWIAINPDQSIEEQEETVAHETSHALFRELKINYNVDCYPGHIKTKKITVKIDDEGFYSILSVPGEDENIKLLNHINEAEKEVQKLNKPVE